jgi:uncharacterized protein
MTDIPATAARLGLERHPEGGWFRRTWTAPTVVETPGGPRPTATGIHYLLTAGEVSRWHVVTSDELWLWHGPGTLDLRLGGEGEMPLSDDEATTVTLGPDLQSGHAAQCLVPAGTWQAARLAGSVEVLVSCIVSPGFSFDDWKLASEAL